MSSNMDTDDTYTYVNVSEHTPHLCHICVVYLSWRFIIPPWSPSIITKTWPVQNSYLCGFDPVYRIT